MVTALVPKQYAEVKVLVLRIMSDIGDGDIADIETALLNAAETAGINYLEGMGSPAIQAIIAVVRLL